MHRKEEMLQSQTGIKPWCHQFSGCAIPQKYLGLVEPHSFLVLYGINTPLDFSEIK